MDLPGGAVRGCDGAGVDAGIPKTLYMVSRLKIVDAVHGGGDVAGDCQDWRMIVSCLVKASQKMISPWASRPGANPKSSRELRLPSGCQGGAFLVANAN